MLSLASKLRELTETLGITNVEAAKRCGLDKRRYGHYATGRSRPNYETLIKICINLGSTPNLLLGFTQEKQSAEIEQLTAICKNLSAAEVAERVNLDSRRYGHYVTGRSEPDLGTLCRIAEALKTTPNQLLDFPDAERSPQVSRLVAACQYLNPTQIEMLIDFAEASLKKKP